MRTESVALKTSIEIARQKKACIIVQEILRRMREFIDAGISTAELNTACRNMIDAFGVTAALKGYRGFPGSMCTSVNHVAAHGVPGNYRLSTGDIVTLDLCVEVDGWFGDGAWTYLVGTGYSDRIRLIATAWKAVSAGIHAARAGNTFGDVGYAIKRAAKAGGCRIIERFVGHGIGREMHEEPIVMNTGEPRSGMRIVPGMVFTIEPILTIGATSVRVLQDGWTIVTNDASPCAQFEHTVAVFADRTDVLTFSGDDVARYIDFPPYF